MRDRLPSACASRRARARSVARAAARGRARVRRVRPRRRSRARARPARRRGAPRFRRRRCSTTPTASSRGSPGASPRSAAISTPSATCSSTRRSSPDSAGTPAGRSPPPLGFVALTAVLSINFNVERLARGAPAAWDASVLGRVYGLLYGWQDRLAERFLRERPALSTVGALAQLGMSSQLAAFGLCIAVGRPLLATCGSCSPRSSSSPGSARSLHRLRRFRLSIVELPARSDPDAERTITPEEWARYERIVAEILTAFGMDLDTAGHA